MLNWVIVLLITVIFELYECKINVYTYYDGSLSRNNDLRVFMLKLWTRNWYYQGFNPIILNKSDAKLHPNYDVLKRQFSKYPTINESSYELSCYLRWLAFQNQNDNGIFVDSDIFNFDNAFVKNFDSSISTTVRGMIPMITIGNSKLIDQIVKILTNSNNIKHQIRIENLMHVSDMIILQKYTSQLFQRVLSNKSFFHASQHDTEIQKFKNSNIDRKTWSNRLLQLNLLLKKKIILIVPSIIDHQHDPLLSELKRIFTITNDDSTLIPYNLENLSKKIKSQTISSFSIQEQIDKNIDNKKLYILLLKDPIYAQDEINNAIYSSLYSTHSKSYKEEEKILKLNSKDRKNFIDFISKPNVIIGMTDRPTMSRIVLEYEFGFILDSLSFDHGNKSLKSSPKKKSQNHADISLYRIALDKFRKKYSEFESIEKHFHLHH